MDIHAQQNAYASRMRIYAQERRFSEASMVEPPSPRHSLPSMRGEVRASRGLVLALVGRVQEASACAEYARRVTRGLEASTLADAIECVIAVEGGLPHAPASAEKLVDRAFRLGSVDTLVTSFRASPSLMSLLLRLPTTAEGVLFAVRRARDEALAEMHGQPVTSILDPSNALSAREREICDLVTEGLTNKDIAQLLFISETTVKAHIHRIFDKLGVHSRQALALRAIKVRWPQAPMATDSAGSGSKDE